MVMLSSTLLLAGSIPRPARYHTNVVDHFSAHRSNGTYQQRYYEIDTHFGGPGSPIICIMGGEGAVLPSTGIFYPWVGEDLAKRFRALVIQPEHRFYGASQPVGPPPFSDLSLLSPQQALADAVHFIRAKQSEWGCGTSGTANYCPVITFGGSYPGFLSAMMRLRYPAVVDMAYAASAPLTFYAQGVDQYAYYAKVTASAERSLPGCTTAARTAFMALASSSEDLIREMDLCVPLPMYISRGGVRVLREELSMVLMYTFAGLNMANYPPGPRTALHQACATLIAEPTAAGLGHLLRTYATSYASYRGQRAPASPPTSGGCFDLTTQLPAGLNATISSGDWSGVGVGYDGESWDYETCTFLVEAIGTNNATDFFPPRPWSRSWLYTHCTGRFSVTPAPHALADAWGFGASQLVRAGASRIIFTNGLNDGWSVGSITTSPSKMLPVFNMPNGAHHSDLSHSPPSADDTPDVTAVRAKAAAVIAQWLSSL